MICLKIGLENLNGWKKVDISLIVLSLQTKTREAKCRPHYFKMHRKSADFNIKDLNIVKKIDLGHQTQGFSLFSMWFVEGAIGMRSHS